jgi:hypothetical protein
VKRRIDEMAQNVKDILLERLRHSDYFALQLDESHDISNNANLVAFVRYEHEIKVCEDFLFCESLLLNPTAEAIFKVVNDFITMYKYTSMGKMCRYRHRWCSGNVGNTSCKPYALQNENRSRRGSKIFNFIFCIL